MQSCSVEKCTIGSVKLLFVVKNVQICWSLDNLCLSADTSTIADTCNFQLDLQAGGSAFAAPVTIPAIRRVERLLSSVGQERIIGLFAPGQAKA